MTDARQPTYWPTNGWRRSAPEDHGVDAPALTRAAHEARDSLPTLCSLLVISNGHIIFEEHYRGPTPGDLYSVRSVTKSVTSALVGIAQQEGTLAGLDQQVAELLPEHIAGDADPRKRMLTVEDLLTMRAGLRWDEPRDEWKLYGSEDWVAFTLGLPLASDPGTRFAYNTGVTQVLAAILTKMTEMPLSDYARERLFQPLGIRRASWETDPQGLTIGGFGLSLTAEDLARIGYLYLHDGRWDGRQIVPAAYVRASTTAWSAGGFPEQAGYGYQWWVTREVGEAAFFAAGYGGQYLYVVPARDTIVVTTARYDVPPEQTLDRDVITGLVLPAIRGGGASAGLMVCTY
jgi:CubicO group peptidase (beta-lactamase class C family)